MVLGIQSLMEENHGSRMFTSVAVSLLLGTITVIVKSREKCHCSAPSSLFIQSRKVSHEMVSLTFRVALNLL